MTAPLSIGQVIFESYLPRKKIYSTRPGLHDGTFFQDLQGNNLIFGKFCIWPFALLLCLEDHHRYRNLFFATLSVAKRKTEKKKKLQKLSLTVMILFHLILHPTVPIFYIYYSLFHLFSFVVVSVLQSFDAHGKEEKLSPGVYNLVRIKL